MSLSMRNAVISGTLFMRSSASLRHRVSKGDGFVPENAPSLIRAEQPPDEPTRLLIFLPS